ncbi:sulfatase [Pelagicoccus enzymogenes]|uniref:sulfatase family protein n=1 Tax=Pelagicoccus enzymogenes TaxID=2773457 RepID=UPI00280F5CFC|nr:sulfatase [Pelagicoccus enzymogenes]MDQ8197986.1 sulfatase [Pelagicoccus enzymogenes]
MPPKYLLLALLPLLFASCSPSKTPSAPPNIVIIFLDDAGWADFQPFGKELAYPTPHVDQLAREGRTFTQFYVPQAVCSASRAALLSGSYPERVKVFGAHAPRERGLEPSFPILPEILGRHGYATALFGKWHLGDHEDTRPHARGFQETAGLMYSNDMWSHHPSNPEFWGKYPLQYWENGEVTDPEITPEDQKQLTKGYTEQAVSFIQRHADQPFFLYVPHSMPHTPLYASDSFEGKSGAGLYGDVIMELDWSVGQINQALKDNGLEENTIVIFTSDNGPWLTFGEHAGKTPFREGKRTSFDGGTRSALVVKFPGQIPANSQSAQTFCSIDLLPTFCQRVGIDTAKMEIDGKDQWPILSGDGKAGNGHDYYAFTTVKRLEAIMSGDGRWKLHLPHGYHTVVEPGVDGQFGKSENRQIELSLFDLKNDPFETKNIIAEHPEIARRLQAYANAHRARFFEAQP